MSNHRRSPDPSRIANRARTVPRLLVGLAAAAALVAGVATAPASSAPGAVRSAAAQPQPDPRPNIILITTDDQTVADLQVMSTVLDELGGRGTTFTNAYSPYPLCCPARATLLTGQYSHNHGVQGNAPPAGGFQALDDTNTLPLWLQEAGYNTVMLGKYLNAYPAGDPTYVPPGWDDWQVPVAGIYNFYDYTVNVDGEQVRYTDYYNADYIGDKASEAIEEYAAQDEPFYLWAGFLAPHGGGPLEPDDPRAIYGPGSLGTPAVEDEFRDAFAARQLPDKASINEDDISDKPAFIERPKYRRDALRELYQQRLESLLSVDAAVGQMLAAAEASGELENTVVIFTSDNGFLVGEHRRVGKTVAYEESARVPFIVAGPGFGTGATREQSVSLVDVVPTIAAVARADTGLVQDGLNLRTLVNDPERAMNRPVLLQAGPRDGRTERWYTAVRSRNHVYVEYDTGETEFYDLGADPLQLDNIRDPGTKSVMRTALESRLASLRDCAGSSCRRPFIEPTT